MTNEAIDPKGIETMLVLQIDQLGKRYGLLPSEIMNRATTFDLCIMDMSISYENYLRRKDQPGHIEDIPTEDLVKAFEAARK